MKTHAMTIQAIQPPQMRARQQYIPAMAVSRREIRALSGALTAAATLILLFVWVAGLATSNLIAAGTWGLGFIFLGLAIDNRKGQAILRVGMGVALLCLALLQVTVSPGFTIVSGALVTTWVAVTVYKQLQQKKGHGVN